MPYLGYLLAQAVKAGQSVASALTSAASYASSVGSSIMSLKPSKASYKSLGDSSPYISDGLDTTIPAIPGSDMTISCWVYMTSNSGTRVVWSTQEGVGYGYQYLLSNDSQSYFTSMWGTGNSSTSYVTSQSGTLVLNKWTHVTCVHTAATNYIYIDGVLSNQSAAGTTAGASNTYKIGCYGTIGTLPVNGHMSNWALWRRALNASEIRSIMHKRYEDLTISETSGLVSYYHLDDLASNTFTDSHGGNNGTY